MTETPFLPTLVGLVLAVGGPALLASPLHRWLGDEDALATRIADQLCLLALVAGVAAVVVLWEGRPLASIGWRGIVWESLAWASLLAFLLIRVLVPLEVRVLRRFGLEAFDRGLAKLRHMPPPFLIFAAVVAGVSEETLFRGYAFTRIAELSDSEVFAGVLTVAVFAQIHLRLWGWGPIATFVINGGLLTAFFAWRHDLLANITAHALTDLVGLLGAAAQARQMRKKGDPQGR